MKVALVHDYIKEYGGAERVLEALHEAFPRADVYTSLYLPSYLGPHRERFASWNIRTSFLQYIPFKAKLISPFRLLSPLVFRSFDFSSYDVIITSSTGAYFPNSLNKGKAKLFCYCHTPPRYLYGYATAREWKKHAFLKAVGELVNHILRIVDFKVSENVDVYIANSEEVRARINKFYRKEAVVIYPPVEINSEFRIQNSESKTKREYFLTGGRLARAKHVDLIVRAAKELKIPLKVFGKAFAGYGEELRAIVKGQEQIEFVGEVSDEEKLLLMRGAKAFLFASEDEDFGITPVEAMGQGVPVIAYRSGGVKETVVDGETGLFFDELHTESLKKAITKLQRMKFDEKVCRKRAKEFEKAVFLKKITTLVRP